MSNLSILIRVVETPFAQIYYHPVARSVVFSCIVVSLDLAATPHGLQCVEEDNEKIKNISLAIFSYPP